MGEGPALDFDLVDLLTKAGPYVAAIIFFYMWKQERDERTKIQDRLYKAVEVIERLNGTLRNIYSLFAGVQPQGLPPIGRQNNMPADQFSLGFDKDE